MQVVNKRIFINDSESIICPKCNADVTHLRDDSYRTYNNWNNTNDNTTCEAEEYVICPKCGERILLTTWTEEF